MESAMDVAERDVQHVLSLSPCKPSTNLRLSAPFPSTLQCHHALLAISNRFGWVVYVIHQPDGSFSGSAWVLARASELEASLEEAEEYSTPQFPLDRAFLVIPTSSFHSEPSVAITHVSFATCDRLILVGLSDGTLCVFSLYTLVHQRNAQPLRCVQSSQAFLLSTLVPNPSDGGPLSGLVAVLQSDGLIRSIDCYDGKTMWTAKSATAAEWSPLGKRLCVGFSDGSLQYFTPEGSLKATVPPPAQVVEQRLSVLGIKWLDQKNHIVTFCDLMSSEPPTAYETYCLHVARLTDASKHTFSRIEQGWSIDGDFALPPRCYLEAISAEQASGFSHLVVLSFTNSTELGMIGYDAGGKPARLNLNEDQRPSLPASEADFAGTTPLGVAVSFSSKSNLPLIWCVTSDGVLALWKTQFICDGAPHQSNMWTGASAKAEDILAISENGQSAPPSENTPSTLGKAKEATVQSFVSPASSKLPVNSVPTSLAGPVNAFGRASTSCATTPSSPALLTGTRPSLSTPAFGQPSLSPFASSTSPFSDSAKPAAFGKLSFGTSSPTSLGLPKKSAAASSATFQGGFASFSRDKQDVSGFPLAKPDIPSFLDASRSTTGQSIFDRPSTKEAGPPDGGTLTGASTSPPSALKKPAIASQPVSQSPFLLSGAQRTSTGASTNLAFGGYREFTPTSKAEGPILVGSKAQDQTLASGTELSERSPQLPVLGLPPAEPANSTSAASNNFGFGGLKLTSASDGPKPTSAINNEGTEKDGGHGPVAAGASLNSAVSFGFANSASTTVSGASPDVPVSTTADKLHDSPVQDTRVASSTAPTRGENREFTTQTPLQSLPVRRDKDLQTVPTSGTRHNDNYQQEQPGRNFKVPRGTTAPLEEPRTLPPDFDGGSVSPAKLNSEDESNDGSDVSQHENDISRASRHRSSRVDHSKKFIDGSLEGVDHGADNSDSPESGTEDPVSEAPASPRESSESDRRGGDGKVGGEIEVKPKTSGDADSRNHLLDRPERSSDWARRWTGQGAMSVSKDSPAGVSKIPPSPQAANAANATAKSFFGLASSPPKSKNPNSSQSDMVPPQLPSAPDSSKVVTPSTQPAAVLDFKSAVGNSAIVMLDRQTGAATGSMSLRTSEAGPHRGLAPSAFRLQSASTGPLGSPIPASGVKSPPLLKTTGSRPETPPGNGPQQTPTFFTIPKTLPKALVSLDPSLVPKIHANPAVVELPSISQCGLDRALMEVVEMTSRELDCLATVSGICRLYVTQAGKKSRSGNWEQCDQVEKWQMCDLDCLRKLTEQVRGAAVDRRREIEKCEQGVVALESSIIKADLKKDEMKRLLRAYQDPGYSTVARTRQLGPVQLGHQKEMRHLIQGVKHGITQMSEVLYALKLDSLNGTRSSDQSRRSRMQPPPLDTIHRSIRNLTHAFTLHFFRLERLCLRARQAQMTLRQQQRQNELKSGKTPGGASGSRTEERTAAMRALLNEHGSSLLKESILAHERAPLTTRAKTLPLQEPPYSHQREAAGAVSDSSQLLSHILCFKTKVIKPRAC